MKVTADIQIDGLPGAIIDLDVTSDGSFVALTASISEEWVHDRPGDGHMVTMHRSRRLHFGALVAAELPDEIDGGTLVRALGHDHALVADRWERDGKPNARIFDRNGRLVSEFRPGGGIQDVVVCGEEFLAFTYFDQGIFGGRFGGSVSAAEGVSIFDWSGTFVFGYGSEFGADGVEISDCYAAAADDASGLWFYPYRYFPIVRVDLTRRTQEKFAPRESITGAKAISSFGDRVFLWSPYRSPGVFYEVPLDGARARRRGTHEGPLRGLPGGRFLHLKPGGYSIISMVD